MLEILNQAQTVDQLIEEWRSSGYEIGQRARRPLNVVGIGAHPDDPETGCGGTLAQFAAKGHHVHLLYLTRGEAGRKGQTAESTASLRTIEALRACSALKASPHFGGQVDGQTVSDTEHAVTFTSALLATNPDIVFTHWPKDTHADHRNVADLTQKAWKASGRRFMLAYYEVMTNIQTQNFIPNRFVDIGPALGVKREAIFAHECQKPERFYDYHVGLETQRGHQSNAARAEAFYLMGRNELEPPRPSDLRSAPMVSDAPLRA